MKILYYFLNLDNMMYQWQKYHIFDELSQHNISVEILSPLDYECIEQANEALIQKVRENRYDLFMTTMNEKDLFVDTLEQIKAHGVPTMLVCPDNLVAPFVHKNISHKFDLVWLTSKETEYLFKRWGCNTIFLPYAANPNFLIPNYESQEIERVGFIGNPHGSRIDRINTLLEGNIPVTIHSKIGSSNKLLQVSAKNYINVIRDYVKYPVGWKLCYAAFKDKLGHRELKENHPCLIKEQPVPLDRLAAANCSYALMLSFTDATSTGVLKKPVPIVNLRNFEIPMSGALQLTTYTDEIAQYFEDDKEIVLCKSAEEYIEKAKFYLRSDNSELRRKMKIAARKRAENEHTWHCRFEKVFDRIGIR